MELMDEGHRVKRFKACSFEQYTAAWRVLTQPTASILQSNFKGCPSTIRDLSIQV